MPRVLREKLGAEASDSLVELLQQFEEEQKDHLIELVEERFTRRVVESENRLREEMHAGFMAVQKQFGEVRAEIGSVHADLSKEIGSVRAELSKEIGSVRAELSKEITVQTRWILTVLVAAAVLIPIIQRVMEALLP